MADIEEFLEKVRELKKREENGLRGKEYFLQLEQIVFTYCPRNCYYKDDYLTTLELINNNKLENIQRIMRKRDKLNKLEREKILKELKNE